jgi:hypothetical protein
VPICYFQRHAAGTVQFSWAGGHGIADLAAVPNAFAGGNWTNTLDLAFGLPTIRINEWMDEAVSGWERLLPWEKAAMDFG